MPMRSLRSILVLLLLVTAGCAAGAGNYGAAVRSTAVDRVFRSGPLPPEYHYYYNGTQGEPVAILGLSRDYTLRARFWTEIYHLDSQMREWRKFFLQSTTWFDDRSGGRMSYDGYRLFDPEGKLIGILYSRYEWIVVELLPDNGVLVHPPQPYFNPQSLWDDRPVHR